MCIPISDSDWETEYNWELSYEREYPDVTLYEVRELEDEVAELRSQNNNESNTTNNEEELQDQLEEREERIDELESQVTELEAELENENDVVFNIDVSPRTGEQFKVGGHAAISVDPKAVEHTQLQDLRIIHKDEEYTVDHNGQGSIPLEESGDHEITFQYEDTTETVVLTAVEDPEDTPEETAGTSDPNDGGKTAENGTENDPGIGDDLTFWGYLGVGLALVGATAKYALTMSS